jgi:hypothetical protein
MTGTFQMAYDQRMVVKFLFTERTDARDIADRLQTQFREHTYKFQTVRFWITKVRLGHQDFHDEIRTRKPPLKDLDAKILAILDKSPFESTRSIAETLRVAHLKVLLH